MFQFKSISDYHQALSDGSVSCLEAVMHYLEKIDSRKNLNAFIAVYADEAIARAKELDESRKTLAATGKLHGVVVAIKDVLCYANHPVTAASKILSGFTSVYHATAVERLLAQGAIIIGSSNCDEFAMGSTNENSAYGNVLNAADESRVPGGSSGGSAVAVQAGMCMVSLGSDTGGSVRQPADHCGIIGLKPTYGRISRYGLIAYASSFDQIGIFAQNIDDAATVLETISGPDNFDSTVSQRAPFSFSAPHQTEKKYKIAYFKEALHHPSVEPEISTALTGLIEQLKAAGHQVEPVQFDMMDYVVPAYYILTTAEASSNLSRFDGVKYGYRAAQKNIDLTDLYKISRSEGFGTEVKRRIMLGTFVLSTGFYDAYFTRAQKVRELLIRKMQLIFNEFDHILLPTVTNTAPAIGQQIDDPIAMYLADIYTVIANLAGIPAISLPLFKHSNGMPFGVQIMSNHFNELPLLSFSKELMG